MTYQYEQFDTALRLLNGRLVIAGAPNFNLVVCGGTALVATELVMRATRDVDVVALADDDGELIDPAPLPEALERAAREVAEDLGLPRDWLNNGPSRGEGGLFRLGLPDGFADRLSWKRFGEKLTVAFIDRIDQIHFKLYAAVDQFGSYHATDLQALNPTDDELLRAVAWSRTHDPSEGYLESIKLFFREFGYEHLVERI
ncbi:nucleotidyl transferase AbiEii/AbiGii toxin family protein [Geothermobacter ehrlichii]|uniref:nucleotidyl transferase AbiEii/AbiGii toxin family protein n=1 Tax=Geothermobacter ehrlichii TaxID=213224 RepID=UPI0011E82B91|nr:nucleotidyl transferase AbiEii/AbiGii toxin family protein [Geothermobacter ehrlichii]